MAKKKNLPPPGLGQGSGYYTQQIVKRLEHAFRYSHERPYRLFEDWLRIVEVTLEALPDQLKAVARTGRLALDPPETAEVFAEVRARYENPHHPAASRAVWGAFGEAFALLLESAEPGLWGDGSYGRGDCGYMGPDVLGHVYMTYANADPGWRAQFFSPYNISLLMAQMTIMDGARQVYDRIKAACLHPDNLLGQAIILASLVIPDGVEAESNLHRDYFFNRVLPSCVEFYEPILFNEPAIGSGVIMLAAASQYPEWAVKLNLVRFTGQDIDPTCVRMAKLNSYLYGLNGYALRLAEAVSVATEARQNRAEPLMAAPLKSVGAAIEQTTQECRQQPDGPAPPDELSFEALFKRAAQPVVAEEVRA